MNERKERKLKDIGCSFLSGYGFKSNEYAKSGIPLIKIGNIQNNRVTIDPCGDFISDGILTNRLKQFLLMDGDLLIAMTGQGSVGRVGKLKIAGQQKALLNQRVGKFLCDEININIDYLYYILTSEKYQDYLFNTGLGSGQPNLSPDLILETEIPYPDFQEQLCIASILSSLDDKIDLLYHQNKTLEAMAETLFRQWFIEKVEDSWNEIHIADLFEVTDGTHDSPKQQSFGKKLLTSKHLLKNKLDLENSYFISETDFVNINKRSRVEQFDILFSMIGTVGSIYFEQSKHIDYAVKNIGIFKTSQNLKWAYFTYMWLNSSYGKQFIHEHKTGSTQEYIPLANLRTISFVIPSEKKVESFNKLIIPYFNKIFFNINHIEILKTIRDTLLPKLITGEVRVKF